MLICLIIQTGYQVKEIIDFNELFNLKITVQIYVKSCLFQCHSTCTVIVLPIPHTQPTSVNNFTSSKWTNYQGYPVCQINPVFSTRYSNIISSLHPTKLKNLKKPRITQIWTHDPYANLFGGCNLSTKVVHTFLETILHFSNEKASNLNLWAKIFLFRKCKFTKPKEHRRWVQKYRNYKLFQIIDKLRLELFYI